MMIKNRLTEVAKRSHLSPRALYVLGIMHSCKQHVAASIMLMLKEVLWINCQIALEKVI